MWFLRLNGKPPRTDFARSIPGDGPFQCATLASQWGWVQEHQTRISENSHGGKADLSSVRETTHQKNANLAHAKATNPGSKHCHRKARAGSTSHRKNKKPNDEPMTSCNTDVVEVDAKIASGKVREEIGKVVCSTSTQEKRNATKTEGRAQKRLGEIKAALGE